jgi:(E)-4-hydroxy-3-methylbut-2-enyl-diphosphate synthase
VRKVQTDSIGFFIRQKSTCLPSCKRKSPQHFQAELMPEEAPHRRKEGFFDFRRLRSDFSGPMPSTGELISFYRSFLNTFVPEGDYTDSPFQYKRRQTREVKVGAIGIGGNNPVRIQSMTTADTCDTEAVVAEAMALFDAGAEIVRLTAQGPREAKNLQVIRNRLNERGYTGPLVADIHFSPRAAMIAVEYVEKVRINPGNFADTKRFERVEYTDDEYLKELERIHDAFKPLVLRAKELGRALRIGVNHGSLSDRIMNRYGDTPEGMVESAIEYLKIAELYDFRDMVVSMKASNPYVMIQAYRMLVERFRKEKMDYPLHLGVTEAGDGRDGRIKSAIGTGSLLLDGIGDTIRVSLTEDAVFEIPAAMKILKAAQVEQKNWRIEVKAENESLRSPYRIQRRRTAAAGIYPLDCGASRPVKAAAPIPLDLDSSSLEAFLKNPPDYLFVKDEAKARSRFPQFFGNVERPSLPVILWSDKTTRPIPDDCGLLIEDSQIDAALLDELSLVQHPVFVRITVGQMNPEELLKRAERLLSIPSLVLALDTGLNPVYPYRWLAECLGRNRRPPPFLLYYTPADEEDALFRVSAEAGSLLLSGIGDVLGIGPVMQSGIAYQTVLDILQATRLRITKTEYISCPSCGRTLFDLQSTTARIKEVTGHLKGVKIAVMGCIVNGPGEMADADFGYVGSAPGKINLYRGREVIRKNIDSEVAPQELIALIRESGMWQDP